MVFDQGHAGRQPAVRFNKRSSGNQFPFFSSFDIDPKQTAAERHGIHNIAIAGDGGPRDSEWVLCQFAILRSIRTYQPGLRRAVALRKV